jgi:hypothetical protein
LFTVTDGKANVGVAVMVGVSVIVGVNVIAGMSVKTGVKVEVGVAVNGTTVGVAVCAPGKLPHARITKIASNRKRVCFFI